MSPDRENNIPNSRQGGSAEHTVRYDVNELLKGGREAILEHNGSEYRLRITSNGRLILTK